MFQYVLFKMFPGDQRSPIPERQVIERCFGLKIQKACWAVGSTQQGFKECVGGLGINREVLTVET